MSRIIAAGSQDEVIEFGSDESDQAMEMLRRHDHKYKLFAVPADMVSLVGATQAFLEHYSSRKECITEAEIQKIMEVMQPQDPFAEVNKLIEFDNAKLRAQFLTTVPTLTSAEIHRLAGRTGGNSSLTANRWKNVGKVFAVTWNGQDRYPAFQFMDGEPKKVIQDILRALPDDMTPWQRALWFISGNGMLDGRTPMESLDDVALVVEAAHREAEKAVG